MLIPETLCPNANGSADLGLAITLVGYGIVDSPNCFKEPFSFKHDSYLVKLGALNKSS